MRILITGGAGFIGSHLLEHQQGRAEVVILDDFRSGHHRNLRDLRHRLVEGSIMDDAALDEAVQGVDRIFHLAAMVSVPESVLNPAECERINVIGTRRILDAAVRAGVRSVVLASSAAIYGNDPAVPKVETMPASPQSPYASSKLAGEQLLERYRLDHGLATASLRFFNVFGPRQDPRSAYAAAVPIFIAQALRNEPIMIHGDGGQTRDFVYVKDVVSALDFVATSCHLHGTFNVGYGASLSIRELAAEIIRLTDSDSVITPAPERPGDVRHSVASADRLRSAGWVPHHTVAGGLAETVAYFRSLMA